MHKTSWKNRAPLLCLGLLIASSPVLAGFNDDPDCKAVSDGAKMSANRILGRIDERAMSTGAAIASAKNCVDAVTSQANRAVPDFGGGIVDTLSKFATDLLAKQGCQIINNAQNQATQQFSQATLGQLPSGAQPAAANAIGSITGGTTGASTAASPSIWQRITNLF